MNILKSLFGMAQSASDTVAGWISLIIRLAISIVVSVLLVLLVIDILDPSTYAEDSFMHYATLFLLLADFVIPLWGVFCLCLLFWAMFLSGKVVFIHLKKLQCWLGAPSRWLKGWLMPLLACVFFGLFVHTIFNPGVSTPTEQQFGLMGLYFMLGIVCLCFGRLALLGQVAFVGVASTVLFTAWEEAPTIGPLGAEQAIITTQLVGSNAYRCEYNVEELRLRRPPRGGGARRARGRGIDGSRTVAAVRNGGSLIVQSNRYVLTNMAKLAHTPALRVPRAVSAEARTTLTTGQHASTRASRTFTTSRTNARRSTAESSRQDHYAKHGSRLNEGRPPRRQLRNANEYAAEAQRFMNRPPKGTLTRRRYNGDIVRYDPQSRRYGAMSETGEIRTYMKLGKKSPRNPHGYAPEFKSDKEYFYG